MARVTQRPSGKWQARYRPEGAGIERSAGTYPTKRAAMRAAVEAEAARPTSSTTWGTWVEAWWPTRQIEPATVENEAAMLRKHIAPTFAARPLNVITRHDVQAWATALTTPPNKLAPGSARRVLGILVSSLSAAVDANLIETNPAVRIKLPPVPRGREVFLTHDQADALLDAIPNPADAALVHFLLNTGLRWGEAAGLHWHHIDTERGIVTVSDVYSTGEIKPYPKGRRSRYVPVFDWVMSEIPRPDTVGACPVKHRDGECRSGLVFPAPGGGARDDRNFSRRVLAPALERAGIDGVTLHDLRHTYASWLVQSGVSLERIADLLGHASLSTTQIYTHLAPARHDELEAALTGKRGANGARTSTIPHYQALRAVGE